jgi:hypothetical protein
MPQWISSTPRVSAGHAPCSRRSSRSSQPGLSTRQRRLADEAALAESARQRDDLRRAEAIQQRWDRYVWVVDHANEVGIRSRRDCSAGSPTQQPNSAGILVEFSCQFALELFAATAAEHRDTNRSEEGDNGNSAGPTGGVDRRLRAKARATHRTPSRRK